MLKDVAILDKMYELNLTYFKELTMYIMAGKKKLEEVRATKLAELTQKAQQSGAYGGCTGSARSGFYVRQI